jgi:hypothetical protein
MSLHLERSDRGIRSNEMPSLGSLFLYFSGVKCPTGRQPGLCSPGAPLASEEMPHVEERFSGWQFGYICLETVQSHHWKMWAVCQESLPITSPTLTGTVLVSKQRQKLFLQLIFTSPDILRCLLLSKQARTTWSLSSPLWPHGLTQAVRVEYHPKARVCVYGLEDLRHTH